MATIQSPKEQNNAAIAGTNLQNVTRETGLRITWQNADKLRQQRNIGHQLKL